jgi:hypothetical protein
MPNTGKFTTTSALPPRLDGRRESRGRAQLSPREKWILDCGRHVGVRVCHEAGATVFRCSGQMLARQTVLRLLQLRYLVPAADGLFGADTAQTLLINLVPRKAR